MISLLSILLLFTFLTPIVVRYLPWKGVVLAIAPASGFIRVFGSILGWWQLPSFQVISWVPEFGVNFALRLDAWSTLFLLLILGIGTLVLIYADEYMKGDKQLTRFYILLLLFMAAMVGVVTSDNAIVFFVFWEATSLTSYLLIGFHYEDSAARVAARKALFVTGAGGLSLLGGFILIHSITDSWLISVWLQESTKILSHPFAQWAVGMVILGGLTKSAQFPFHFWLPAAMAGPTPVSAYLHSATMVKAGVFLLARFYLLWSPTWVWPGVLVGAGATTMLFSAWSALRLHDLKAILAYTTTMALGLLVMLLGLGDYASLEAAVVYLVVHALYKGSLFMIAGIVDHGAHTRDLRQLSGLRTSMPITFGLTLLPILSMIGLPPTLGFVGKEAIYAAHIETGSYGLIVLLVSVAANVALFAVGLMLTIKPFGGQPSEAAKHAHEGHAKMLIGPVILGVLGLGLGLLPYSLDSMISDILTDITAHEAHTHLALWHGPGPALWASLLTYGIGAALYAGLSELNASKAIRYIIWGFVEGPPRWFEKSYLAGAKVARQVTEWFYGRALRRHIMGVLMLVSIIVTYYLIENGGINWPKSGGILPHEAVVVVVLVIASTLGAFAEPTMRAIISVGISGYCVALLYLFFGAPDVAMTQFAIETLTVILVVLTLAQIPASKLVSYESRLSIRDLGAALLTGTLICTLLLGALAIPLSTELSDTYLQTAVPKAHGHNVVNVILVDFRGFDTFGEITVLTVSGLGVYALLRRRANNRISEG